MYTLISAELKQTNPIAYSRIAITKLISGIAFLLDYKVLTRSDNVTKDNIRGKRDKKGETYIRLIHFSVL